MKYCGNINYLSTIKKIVQLHYFFPYLHPNLMKRECQDGTFWQNTTRTAGSTRKPVAGTYFSNSSRGFVKTRLICV